MCCRDNNSKGVRKTQRISGSLQVLNRHHCLRTHSMVEAQGLMLEAARVEEVVVVVVAAPRKCDSVIAPQSAVQTDHNPWHPTWVDEEGV